MIDPLERWRELGLPDKPDYAGLLTYAGMPYTQDPAELAPALERVDHAGTVAAG